MRVQVHLFARARELYGKAATEMELPDRATVADCFAELTVGRPRLGEMRDRLMAARNEQYASWEESLEDGDDLAFIPPVSGG